MKVLLLTDRMENGGAETHIVRLALGLRAAGVEVALLSGGGRLADLLESQGIRQYCVKLPSYNPIVLLGIRRLIRRLIRREGFRILHAHARLPAMLLRGCERFGAVSVVSLHAMFRNRPFWKCLSYWGRHTVAVSEDLRAYAIKTYRLSPMQVRVIPNGIDCTAFSPSCEASAGEGVQILFASRLDEDCARGAELLCRIAPMLCTRDPQLRIKLVGGGSAHRRISEQAARVNAALGREAIVLTGQVSDMPPLLCESAIFVGVSRAAMEAAACGAAVILCGNEGYLGILEEDNLACAAWSNFCARGCEEATVEKLLRDLTRLLESEELRRSASAAARSFVCKQFGDTRMCRETLALYQRIEPRRPVARLLLAGYFGCGNLGDNAILQGLSEGLAETHAGIELIALTGSPRRDRKQFGLACIGRKAPFAIFFAMLRADALALGGGSLLQNATSRRSLWYYLGLLRLAQALGKPCFVVSAGIGPLFGSSAVKQTAAVLSRCRSVSLRDGDSYRRLSANGIPAESLHRSGDPALLAPLPPVGRAGYLLRGLERKKGFLCLVLRGGRDCAPVRAILLAAARVFCRQQELTPLFLVFDPRADAAATQQARCELGGEVFCFAAPEDATAVLSSSALLVTMRLHAAILGAAAGTPFIGLPTLSGESKLSSFAKEAGGEFLSPDRLSAASLAALMESALASRSAIAPILRDSTDQMRKKAAKDLANIAEMIYNKKQKQE